MYEDRWMQQDGFSDVVDCDWCKHQRPAEDLHTCDHCGLRICNSCEFDHPCGATAIGRLSDSDEDEDEDEDSVAEQKEDRLELVGMAAYPINRLINDVCPACKAKEGFQCEIVEGVHTHVQSGECKASPILQLLSHLDDIRHQFANEFNQAELPRSIWQGRLSKECGCCGETFEGWPPGACKCGRVVCAQCWHEGVCLVCYADPMVDEKL